MTRRQGHEFLLTPLREGRPLEAMWRNRDLLFLLTPLREGRHRVPCSLLVKLTISTHAPAGGATNRPPFAFLGLSISTHAPAGGATLHHHAATLQAQHFYSRPCGRGDVTAVVWENETDEFLLTPLREGRPEVLPRRPAVPTHFYSRPCGRGDLYSERRQWDGSVHFYSRPCGRGDPVGVSFTKAEGGFLLTPLREGRP